MPDSDSSPASDAARQPAADGTIRDGATRAGPVHEAVHHALDEVDHEVENVERAIESAETRLGERAGFGAVHALELGWRLLVWLAVASYFIVAGTAVAARYWWLPHADEMRPVLEREAQRVLGRPMHIAHIDAAWDGVRPRLRLQGVELLDEQGAVAASLPQVDAVVSWRSLLQLRPVFTSLSVLTAELSVRRTGDQIYEVAGFPIDPAKQGNGGILDWILDQPHIAVRDARVHYIDGRDPVNPATPVEFTDVNLVSRSGLGGNRFALQARPPSSLSDKIDLRLAFSHPWLTRASDFRRWSGRLFVQFDYVDLAAVAKLAAPLIVDGNAIELKRAQGALRLWLDFAAMTSHRVRADVAATDVDLRLAPDLEPLVLTSVSGRITQQPWGGAHEDGEEILLSRFALDQGERLRLPPTDLALRWARPLAVSPGASPGAAAPGDAGSAGSSNSNPANSNPANSNPANSSPAAPPAHGQFEAGRLSLAQLDQLASHLPLPRRLHDTITGVAIAGELSDLSLEWDGDPAQPDHYALRTHFDGLSIPAEATGPPPAPPATTTPAGEPSPAPFRPGRPGFEQLSGSIEATESGGNLILDAHNAVLIFPRLFEEPRIPATTLSANLTWTGSSHSPGTRMQVSIGSLQLANPDLDISLGGTWTAEKNGDKGSGGPGQLDLTGRINRAEATAVARYFPLLPAAAGVRRWLDLALRGGEAADGTLRLRGDLHDFPFVDPRRGEFRIAFHINGGSLDYMPQISTDSGVRAGWPAISGVGADLLFDRDRLTISAGQGTIFGVGLANVGVVVAPLGSAQTRVEVDGEANGPLTDMFRYVNATPIGDWLGHFLASAEGNGLARLKLKFGLPVGRVREPPTASGTLFLAGNDVHLAPFVSPMSHAIGQVEFTEHTLKVNDVEAGYLEGQVRIDGNTTADGTIKIAATGNATTRGVRRQIDVPLVLRLLDRAEGSMRYSANVAVTHGRTQLSIDSDLSGVKLDLPPPLAKAAAETLPLHIELQPRADDPKRDSILISAGNLVDVRLDRTTAERGSPRIDHGAIGIGVPATLPELGVIANIDLQQLDLDQWTPVITGLLSDPAAAPAPSPVDGAAAGAAAPAPAGAGAGTGGVPDLVAARVGTLTFAHKVFSHVVLGASRSGNAWTANVQSDHISGAVDWQPGEGGGPGRVTARLARLAIPEGQREQVTEMIDEQQSEPPSLDITADEFELGAVKLGRLELVAPATAASWRLEKLDIKNADGHLSATGERTRDPATPDHRKMALNVTLDITDAGRLLARLGFPGAIQGGTGKLSGDLNWNGSPFAIDYPSFAGNLHLQTDKGQFLKAAPGAARLLGVLSLQSLPRRIGLDFRDIFSEGFAFDAINADADIQTGVISTHNFRMRGAAATVLIEGSTDLRAETQDLHVLVLPNVNAGSASLVYALLANPAIGLGTFIAQLILKDPLSKAFSFEYDVTGRWSAPQVVRRDRSHVDAATQQQVLPKP
jgi:uncharacterized protein (TIGR02099 family)